MLKSPINQPEKDDEGRAALVEILLGMLKTGFKAQKLSDTELADIILINIWAEYDIDSIESAVLDETIFRLWVSACPFCENVENLCIEHKKGRLRSC